MSSAGFTAGTISNACKAGLTVSDLKDMTLDELRNFLKNDRGALPQNFSRGKPKFWYLELGAHNGNDAEQFLQQHPSYTPILVEANPAFYVPLQRLCRKYDGKYLNAAAWIRDEILEFQIFPSNDYASSIRNVTPSLDEDMPDRATVLQVQAFDLARYLREVVAEDDHLYVRMDVQGAEYKLLSHLLVSGIVCRIDRPIVEFHAIYSKDTTHYLTLDGAIPWILLACPSIEIATQNFYRYDCRLQSHRKMLDQFEFELLQHPAGESGTLVKLDRPNEGFTCVEIAGNNGHCPSQGDPYAMVCSSWEAPTIWY